MNLDLLARSLKNALDSPEDRTTESRLTLGQLRFARNFYLRLLLGAYLGIPGKSVKIIKSLKGKPSLDHEVHEEDLHFSIAKSDHCIMVGISVSGPVGVDLEPADRRAHDPMAVARRYFSASEALALETVDPEIIDQAFLRVWACKEAVVKASGEGIANQLNRFSVETDPARPPAVLEFEGDDPSDWALSVMRPQSGFIAAVAAHHELAGVQAFRLLPMANE